MKSKLLAVLLALNVMCWAQTATPNPTPAPEKKSAPAEAKPTCPCCDKMGADHAAMKDMQGCCMRKDATTKDGKDAMPCCAGMEGKGAMACGHDKDAKASAKDDKPGDSCCASGKCGEGKEKSCCAAKEGDTARGCCGGNSCGKHEHATPGN